MASYSKNEISYHPQSGWFEDTPLKGGTEEGCPLKGVHEGTFLIESWLRVFTSANTAHLGHRVG